MQTAAATAGGDDIRDLVAETRSRITHAARRCFDRFGIPKTTVDDVAKEAGLSRATVYRYVPGGRSEIIVLVMMAEAEARLVPLGLALLALPTFAEVLTEGIAWTVESVREDEWLQMLIAPESVAVAATSADAQVQMLRGTAAILAPFLERARQSGEISSDISDSEISEWVERVVLGLTSFQSDLVRSPESLRRFVRRFAVAFLT